MTTGAFEGHYRFRKVHGATGVWVIQRPRPLARAVDSSEASAGLLSAGEVDGSWFTVQLRLVA
jgi:hypothetical protein